LENKIYTNPSQKEGEWFVLLRNPGSGKIKTTEVYEAQTMDSLYVIRGGNIVQETPDKAIFQIRDIVPGEYIVTAIENPRYQGSIITRQQSKPLTIRAGEEAILDFDLRDKTE
jgi:hypothetical protein